MFIVPTLRFRLIPLGVILPMGHCTPLECGALWLPLL